MVDIASSCFNPEIPDYLWFSVSLSLTGLALLFVHYSKELISERINKRRVVHSNLRHLLKSSQYLIKKIVPLLLQPKPKEINQDYIKNTAYRISHLLSTIRYFQHSTATMPDFNLLHNVDMFLDRKIPMSLRANIYHHTPLTSEVQEDISLAMFEYDSDISPVGFHLRLFKNSIEGNTDYEAAYESVINFLTFKNEVLSRGMSLDSEDWRKYIALCHFSVYLIDLYSVLGKTPEWEESRLYFVSKINEWNAMAGSRMRKKVYLYEVGDLNSNNYLDTFPSVILARHIPTRILEILVKWIVLRKRSRKYKHIHLPKYVSHRGVKITANRNTLLLRYSQNSESIRHLANDVLMNRLSTEN